ncbi:acyl-CoA dehydrogenase family protein [Umezawaea endophytica]|uniref:Acyl-CoA/acyl-ACP dehydrogenase n=1 Tax=Umezawaea endophytica TaxID=1654476 RepID=A0A9X3AE09_9PSEU|nr:acyl-CoA dehydrogenase family protein [Umezawaea endophytica]MCS7476762.1 acyl-CoA/acyl-ACP dehydrogenase [Umezawaea endophytica]
MSDALGSARELVSDRVGDRAGEWDRAGRLPLDLLRDLGSAGVLCAQVPVKDGGLGLSSKENGELTAHLGALCGSTRSVATSQGMAAWVITRLGSRRQRTAFLPRLTGGELAAVAFSEPEAGSDLAAMATEIRRDGDDVVVSGEKVWITVGAYADLVVVFGRFGDGAAAVVVPTAAAGVVVERVEDPLGCRAAGHATVRLDSVRVPADHLLGAAGQSLSLLVTSALTYGRVSIAWGCVGILRSCREAAASHARSRTQSGKPLAEHQLVAEHLAELLVAEQVATRMCEHASTCWDDGSPDLVIASVLAKHVAATNAARGAASAVQVLGSAGARDGHPVARAYRDAKLMEIIEGSNEICRLLLAGAA